MTPTSAHSSPGVGVGEADPLLRRAAVVFLAGLVLHNGDHFRRGVDAVTDAVLAVGSVGAVLSLAAVVLVFRRHPLAATAAFVVGFGMAIGVSAVHLAPDWGTLSDSLPDGQVDGWTWAAVLAEIAGAALFGAAGWAGMRRARARAAADAATRGTVATA